jgi:hypothetical protein
MEKLYRVKRYSTSSSLADNVAILCAESNGCVFEKLTIAEIKGYVECEIKLYPATNDEIMILNISDFHFMIMKGERPLVEVMETEVFSEVPTLDVQDQSKN